ncbi:MAG TPA: response regulator [Verrucomicrobiae bacterium]|jgi:CheY-like chemotaxis protein|nr:response regulator [Verrucomicrobiae bacterium]
MDCRSSAQHFLVVEDNADDALLMRRAVNSSTLWTLTVCRTLAEAKCYLLGTGVYSNRTVCPFPQAILCDLHLNGESADDLLRWMRDKPAILEIPFTILSGSISPSEMATANELGARHVLRKPAKFDDLKRLLLRLSQELPTQMPLSACDGL